jgi:hypothetical protein
MAEYVEAESGKRSDPDMASNVSGAVAVAVASGRLNARRRWLDQDEPHGLVHSAKKDPHSHFAKSR